LCVSVTSTKKHVEAIAWGRGRRARLGAGEGAVRPVALLGAQSAIVAGEVQVRAAVIARVPPPPPAVMLTQFFVAALVTGAEGVALFRVGRLGAPEEFAGEWDGVRLSAPFGFGYMVSTLGSGRRVLTAALGDDQRICAGFGQDGGADEGWEKVESDQEDVETHVSC